VRLRDAVAKVGGLDRECEAEQTWSAVLPHLHRVGVTRVANISHLDRLGLPVYTAIVPRSRDGISVYAGKGLRLIDAKVSAVMEAVERFAAWLPLRPDAIASYRELVDAGRAAMDPTEHSLRLSAHYRDDRPISWVAGHDLMRDEPMLVPHGAVVCIDIHHEPPCYVLGTSNGLAAGNSLEEAVVQGLCELIERDSMTIAELIGAHLSKRMPRAATRLRSRYPHFDLASLPGPARELVDRFRAGGVDVRVVDMTTDTAVPSVWCTTLEDFGPGRGQQAHGGSGTHPDLTTAMVRGLTECAQSRAVDIQGVREDMSAPDAPTPGIHWHTQRSNTFDKSAWEWAPAGEPIPAASRPSAVHDDVAADLRLLLDRLAAAGFERAIAVDLSPPGVPVRVVRMIVPGLESWAADRSHIGNRATAAWNAAARQVTQ
jgi:ribosomal protein S12 methylthiotransferase accessory factor